jgi:hypothetical protein
LIWRDRRRTTDENEGEYAPALRHRLLALSRTILDDACFERLFGVGCSREFSVTRIDAASTAVTRGDTITKQIPVNRPLGVDVLLWTITHGARDAWIGGSGGTLREAIDKYAGLPLRPIGDSLDVLIRTLHIASRTALVLAIEQTSLVGVALGVVVAIVVRVAAIRVLAKVTGIHVRRGRTLLPQDRIVVRPDVGTDYIGAGIDARVGNLISPIIDK